MFLTKHLCKKGFLKNKARNVLNVQFAIFALDIRLRPLCVIDLRLFSKVMLESAFSRS